MTPARSRSDTKEIKMAGLVFGIIFLLAGIIVGIYVTSVKVRETEYKDGRYETVEKRPFARFAALVVMLGILLGGFCTFLGCIASVPTGNTGVITVFGRVESNTFDAGFNFKAPWQTVINMDNRVQKANTVLSCFSADIQEVTVSYTLNYQIDKANAQELYKTVGVSYYETIIVPSVAEAVKLVTARYTAEQLVGSRAELALAIEQELSASLARYNIQLASAAIEDMDFTDAFTNAVEAKQVAAQNKLQAEIEQAQKVMEQQAEAERAVIQAQAAAETAKIKAQADLEVVKIEADGVEYAGQKEAAANKAISESLTDELLQYYYIQNWNGELPDTYVGSEDVSMIISGSAVK